jgi:hypothetical protein
MLFAEGLLTGPKQSSTLGLGSANTGLQRTEHVRSASRPSAPFALLDAALQTGRSFRKELRLPEALLDYLRVTDCDSKQRLG